MIRWSTAVFMCLTLYAGMVALGRTADYGFAFFVLMSCIACGLLLLPNKSDWQRHAAMRTALLEARAFIAAECQSFVECSTDPTTHQLDPADYHHADQMTALLARIDAALGEGSKT